jgi:hypothetical protein
LGFQASEQKILADALNYYARTNMSSIGIYLAVYYGTLHLFNFLTSSHCLDARHQLTVKKLRPLDALLPISIVVQLDKAQNSLSLGLLLIWVALRFLDPVVKNRSRNDNRHSGTAYALLIGLLLFQARAIVTRSDETGISQYLMVALGLAVGFSLGLNAWRRLLQWINLATLAISITLLSHFRLEHGWLQDLNRQLFNEGY